MDNLNKNDIRKVKKKNRKLKFLRKFSCLQVGLLKCYKESARKNECVIKENPDEYTINVYIYD